MILREMMKAKPKKLKQFPALNLISLFLLVFLGILRGEGVNAVVNSFAEIKNEIENGNEWMDEMHESNCYKYFVNGIWKESSSQKKLNIFTPHDEKVCYQIQACSPVEIDQAFSIAKNAQKDWARVPLHEKAIILKKAAAFLRENVYEIADALVNEIAKGRKAAEIEIIRSAELLEYTAEEGVRVMGEGSLLLPDSFPGHSRDRICLVQKVPLGVVLCMPPFNYPINLCCSKVGPALMAGNSVVVKTPTQGAVSCLHVGAAFRAAGVPPGVVNFVTGRGSEIGDHLITHPLVDCISFTGGDTGISASHKAGMVPLQMELGGKDCAIVCEDADLDLAASHIVKGAFSYSGQRCTAVKLVIVCDSVADELVQKIVDGVKRLSVGTPDENADITAVINSASADFIESLVDDARRKGADFLLPWQRKGNLLSPVVLDRVTEEMSIHYAEPFGPVLPITRVSSLEEAVEKANGSPMGLQGSIFSNDITTALTVADKMATGTVQINGAPARGPDHFPFQGFKDSGIGTQGVKNSIISMTKIKSVVVNLQQSSYSSGV